jgi:hypothetical protein
MKFKKITKKYNVVRLNSDRFETIKSIYYEVWDKDIHLGNISGGCIGEREWEFIPVLGDSFGLDISGLSIEQLNLIVKKMELLNSICKF